MTYKRWKGEIRGSNTNSANIMFFFIVDMIDLKLLNFKNCHDLTCGFLSIFSKVFETKTSNYWEKNHVQKIKGWIEVTKLQDNWVSKLLNFKNTLIRYWTYSFFQDHFITINIIEHLLKERSKNILQEIN